jgi:hypothetical protein
MAPKHKSVTVTLTEDQFELARRRLFIEGLGWTTVLRALVNAYVMGDVSVTKSGKYYMAPPSNYRPVVHVSKAEDVVEIEPEWGVASDRPQIGTTSVGQVTHLPDKWGTKELAAYMREVTGRKISPTYLRRMMALIEIPKGSNNRWSFDGPDDPKVATVRKAIDEGIYQAIIHEGIRVASQYEDKRRKKAEEIKEAIHDTKMEERARRIKMIKSIEES